MRCAKLRLTRKKPLLQEVHRVSRHEDAFTWCGKEYRSSIHATFMVGAVTCNECLLITKRVSSAMKTPSKP